MTNAPTGGPAFPGKAFTKSGHPNGESMSLRDWFAGQALAGLLAGRSYDHALTDPGGVKGAAASDAYKVADAMLAARTKESGHDE